MIQVNDNFIKLPGNYLFSSIAKKVNAFKSAHPEAALIRLGIGDVRYHQLLSKPCTVQ